MSIINQLIGVKTMKKLILMLSVIVLMSACQNPTREDANCRAHWGEYAYWVGGITGWTCARNG